MAENPGLENHRIKSFKNKGRDVEVSVLPRSGPSWLSRLAAPAPRRRGRAGGRRRDSSCRLAVGRSWPPPPVTATQGWAEQAAGRGPAAGTLWSCGQADREIPGFSAPSRGRGLLSARKGCGAEAGSAGWGLAGLGCCCPVPSTAPPRGWPRLAPVAGATSCRRSPLGASRAAAHGVSALRVPAPTFFELGPGRRWRPAEGGGDQPGN